MFVQPYNELRFSLTIESTSPLLVKEGRLSDTVRDKWFPKGSKERPDIPNAIPISYASLDEIHAAILKHAKKVDGLSYLPYYIPATSLRGVFRSHLEKTLRGLTAPEQPKVCDPFSENKSDLMASCSTVLAQVRDELSDSGKPFHPYSIACPVCRMFGNTLQAGRITITDGVREKAHPGKLVFREHVRIDRKTGSVAPGALIRFAGLDRAQFSFSITIHNFELSHVMLLGALLTDLQQGNITIGSGRNKGYGRVKLLDNAAITLVHYGLTPPADDKLRGVAEHHDPSVSRWFQERYHLNPCPSVPSIPPGKWNPVLPWRHERRIELVAFMAIWPKLSLEWPSVISLAQRTAKTASASN